MAEYTVKRPLKRPPIHPGEVLLEEFLEPRKTETVAQTQDAFEPALAVQRRVVTDRPLDLLNEIRKNRTHRLEYLPGVLACSRGAFEAFGFTERQFESPDQRLGEVVPSDLDRAGPYPRTICNDQVGLIGTHIG